MVLHLTLSCLPFTLTLPTYIVRLGGGGGKEDESRGGGGGGGGGGGKEYESSDKRPCKS